MLNAYNKQVRRNVNWLTRLKQDIDQWQYPHRQINFVIHAGEVYLFGVFHTVTVIETEVRKWSTQGIHSGSWASTTRERTRVWVISQGWHVVEHSLKWKDADELSWDPEVESTYSCQIWIRQFDASCNELERMNKSICFNDVSMGDFNSIDIDVHVRISNDNYFKIIMI